ncbi:MAG: 50S ribosomal protein L25 [Candidatus Daviesbacteria bacterium]|nr:50S ribosomal protein L25 [Candidatus Daviesbacteria bacterium]
MDRIALKAEEREILGKKVKNLRSQGLIPAHVFGKGLQTEHVTVSALEFKKVYDQAGETGLIDLKIGAEKIRPVLIRGVQLDPVRDNLLHIDFYQVNLSVKVKVFVPIEIIGEEAEAVHTGEAVVIQPMSEIEVEALPADLPEKITVDITSLKAIDDAILVSGLSVPEGVTILAEPEAVVVKLDSAVTEEMKRLLEEQAAEAAAAAAAQAPAEGEPASAEATAGKEAEGEKGAQVSTEAEPASAEATVGKEETPE